MKIKIIALVIFTLAVWGLFAVSKLRLEETTVSARYEMLACEGCNHMIIEKSNGGDLDGETIIPISNKVDIEQLVDGVALTKDPLCLSGRLYRFNWNLFGVNPDGMRFEVTEKLSPIACSSL